VGGAEDAVETQHVELRQWVWNTAW
jgi:hypothetical protein